MVNVEEYLKYEGMVRVCVFKAKLSKKFPEIKIGYLDSFILMMISHKRLKVLLSACYDTHDLYRLLLEGFDSVYLYI